MKATFISRENNDVKFTMEFTAEEFENAQDNHRWQAEQDRIENQCPCNSHVTSSSHCLRKAYLPNVAEMS